MVEHIQVSGQFTENNEDTKIIFLFDWRDRPYELLRLVRNFVANGTQYPVAIVDMSQRDLFEHVAKMYSLGNFDTPGVFATKGDKYFYRNYNKIQTPTSFNDTLTNFIEDLRTGTKRPFSTRSILDFFTVNLLNLEFFIQRPMQMFVVSQACLASLLIPMLFFDFFVKPILGYGPTQERSAKKQGQQQKKYKKD